MFIEQTAKRNKELIDAAFSLHQSGQLMPDSYLVDIDSLLANAKKILDEAKKHRIKLYFMLKQLGRNPYIAKELVKMGYDGAVVVDFKEAQVMMDAQVPIGNVGHLVQVPDAMIQNIVAYGPEVITVYSLEKAEKIDKAAHEAGRTQGILLRVYDQRDMIYSGQTAGFPLTSLRETAKKIQTTCKNLNIRGVTSFPCYLYDESSGDIQPAGNLRTVKHAAEILHSMGIRTDIINTPSATCVHTLRKMTEFGGNCGEPGHGFTGTTPMHAVKDMEEIPSVVYVSEISHNFLGHSYCFGGGYYRRSRVSHALVGNSLREAKKLPIIPPADECIDYHFEIPAECRIGDTVVMAFRYQIFVTRSDVALVKGLRKGSPEIVGVYDSQGNMKRKY